MEMHKLAILLMLLVLTGEEHDSLFTRQAVLAKSLPALKRNTAMKRKFISKKFSQKYAGYARRYHFGDYNITSNPSAFENKLDLKRRMAKQHTQSVNVNARTLPRTKNVQSGYRARSDSRLGALGAPGKKPQVRKKHHIIARNGVQTEVIESSPNVQVGGHNGMKSFGFPKDRRPNKKSKISHAKVFHHFHKIPHNRCMEIHLLLFNLCGNTILSSI